MVRNVLTELVYGLNVYLSVIHGIKIFSGCMETGALMELEVMLWTVCPCL